METSGRHELLSAGLVTEGMELEEEEFTRTIALGKI